MSDIMTGAGDSAEEDKVLLLEGRRHFLVGKARGWENKDGCPGPLGEVNLQKTWGWLGWE